MGPPVWHRKPGTEGRGPKLHTWGRRWGKTGEGSGGRQSPFLLLSHRSHPPRPSQAQSQTRSQPGRLKTSPASNVRFRQCPPRTRSGPVSGFLKFTSTTRYQRGCAGANAGLVSGGLGQWSQGAGGRGTEDSRENPMGGILQQSSQVTELCLCVDRAKRNWHWIQTDVERHPEVPQGERVGTVAQVK